MSGLADTTTGLAGSTGTGLIIELGLGGGGLAGGGGSAPSTEMITESSDPMVTEASDLMITE